MIYFSIIGFPSLYGGAGAELYHQIPIWRKLGVKLHFIPTQKNVKGAALYHEMLERGHVIHEAYDWNAITENAPVISFCNEDFLAVLPEYDAAGNQTKVKTSTGIWAVIYDANNRPVSFTSEDGQTVIVCGYDYMGRRFMKKVTVNGTVTLHHHYLYRGYLQIAALDLTRSTLNALWFMHWDPTQPIATRPLSIRKNATWYTYGHDLTKNVTELYKTDGTIATAYDYTPYGAVTAAGPDQPFQWSSEVYDAELGMVYYNYRHYNPMDGRWISRDLLLERGGVNLYGFIFNNIGIYIDWIGLSSKKPGCPDGTMASPTKCELTSKCKKSYHYHCYCLVPGAWFMPEYSSLSDTRYVSSQNLGREFNRFWCCCANAPKPKVVFIFEPEEQPEWNPVPSSVSPAVGAAVAVGVVAVAVVAVATLPVQAVACVAVVAIAGMFSLFD